MRDWQIVPQSESEENVYACPRGIGVHRENQQKCCRQCRNAQGDNGPEYDTENIAVGIASGKS